GVLALLAVANLGVHLGVLWGGAAVARTSLHGALYLVLVLLVIISGRIVPLFTRNALRRRGVEITVEPSLSVERLLVPVMGAAIALALLRPGSTTSGIASLLSGALLALRQARWQPQRTLDQPILWVLHVGHAWLALGFVCTGIAALVPSFPASTALHAFGAGAIGTSIVGVMSRVALGHTGREIEASSAMVIAYALVILGGLVRVFGPLALPGSYRATVIWAGSLWAAGYVLFALRSAPLLTRPRVPSGE
ncbi:MAG: NnrS family protein, partial [Myxococcota bacterium]